MSAILQVFSSKATNKKNLLGPLIEDDNINAIPKPNINADSDHLATATTDTDDIEIRTESSYHKDVMTEVNSNSNSDIDNVVDTDAGPTDTTDEDNTTDWMLDQDNPSKTRLFISLI